MSPSLVVLPVAGMTHLTRSHLREKSVILEWLVSGCGAETWGSCKLTSLWIRTQRTLALISFSHFFPFTLFICYSVCVSGGRGDGSLRACMPWSTSGAQKTTLWGSSSPFTFLSVAEMELRSSGLWDNCTFPLSCPSSLFPLDALSDPSPQMVYATFKMGIPPRLINPL